MKTLNMADAKTLFNAGSLYRWQIERHPLADGWIVLFGVGVKCDWHWHTHVDARKGEERLFKTVDGAVSAVKEAGFKVVKLGM